MDIRWLRQLRPAPCDHVPAGAPFADLFLEMFLRAIHIEGREIISVRHSLQTVPVAADAREPFDVRIPGSDLIIGDGPFDAIAITCRSGKFIMTPTRTGPSPNERFAAYLVAPDPIERFILDIGMILVFDKEMRGIFSETRCRRDQWVLI